MPNVRALNKQKYNISKHRFRELYYFCLQYDEKQKELKDLRNSLKGVSYSDSPSSSGTPGDPTMKIAMKCAGLSNECDAIEEAAKMADPELHDYILYAVTHEGITFEFLKMQKDIPCERDRYYDRRRKFYFVLDNMLRNKEQK